jgi:cell division protein FtsQ
MMRKILTILSVLLLLTCLVAVTIVFAGDKPNDSCTNVQIAVMDKTGESFVQTDEISQLLKQNSLSLVGKKLDEIDYDVVERIAESHRLIERAECYACPSGTVCLYVWQHMPVLHVITAERNYYIDSKGQPAGLSTYSAADVLVATGCINDSMTIRDLYRMTSLLRSDPYWDALIEQIDVQPNGEWVLIPRAGDFEILFGSPVNMETKMKRLGVFIEVYLPKMGWDRYSHINLKYKNQIVCTKKQS